MIDEFLKKYCIEVVGHKFTITVPFELLQDLKEHGFSIEEIHKEMVAEYHRQVCVIRDRKIREVLDDPQISNEIINQVMGINRVVYDISSKPRLTGPGRAN
jgi:hypothetical protein